MPKAARYTKKIPHRQALTERPADFKVRQRPLALGRIAPNGIRSRRRRGRCGCRWCGCRRHTMPGRKFRFKKQIRKKMRKITENMPPICCPFVTYASWRRRGRPRRCWSSVPAAGGRSAVRAGPSIKRKALSRVCACASCGEREWGPDERRSKETQEDAASGAREGVGGGAREREREEQMG